MPASVCFACMTAAEAKAHKTETSTQAGPGAGARDATS